MQGARVGSLAGVFLVCHQTTGPGVGEGMARVVTSPVAGISTFEQLQADSFLHRCGEA